MNRIAIVAGETRGIGAATSIELKDKGCNVAAAYGSDNEKAKVFSEETGIKVFKWDVSDFEACFSGVARVESNLGPVDILVNNAGITRDGTVHKMTCENWQAVIDTNLGSCFNMSRG